MGSLVLRPASSQPPHLRKAEGFPMNLNAPVTRSRPIGRYALNR